MLPKPDEGHLSQLLRVRNEGLQALQRSLQSTAVLSTTPTITTTNFDAAGGIRPP